MSLSRLNRILLKTVVQLFISELLARKIEDAIADDVVTMTVAVGAFNPVDKTSKDILSKKSRNRALPQRLILPGPLIGHSGSAGFWSP